MLRGMEEEEIARIIYNEKIAPVERCGFVTNDKWGFTIGCSPDSLVGETGAIEIKSRRQKFQIATIINGEMPDDYEIQVQTILLVTERSWVDFVSYSNGLPMVPIRVFPDTVVQDAIVSAATAFEAKLADKWAIYRATVASNPRLIPTERRVVEEMF
jgi:predicted phage-related endonuclease